MLRSSGIYAALGFAVGAVALGAIALAGSDAAHAWTGKAAADVVSQVAPSPALPQHSTASPTIPQTPQPQSRDGSPVNRPRGAQETPPVGALLGKPPIEFRPEIVDIGEVRPNQRVQGTAYIQNVGKTWLRVMAAKADCACTKVSISETQIAPGQSVAIDVEYHSNSTMGEKKGEIRVWIEGYDQVAVPVRSFVTLPVRADPAYVAALPGPDGRVPVSGEFNVMSNDQKPFRILAVNGEPADYVGFDPAKDTPRNNYRVKWDFTGYDPKTCLDKSGRRMPGWIVIETDHPDCPVFDIEVRNECTRRQLPTRTDTWLIQEKSYLLGGLKPGEPTEFEVIAKWLPRAAKHDVINSAVSESGQFTVELVSVTPVEDGLACKVRLTPAANVKGLLYGSLRLHSNYQSFPVTAIGSVR